MSSYLLDPCRGALTGEPYDEEKPAKSVAELRATGLYSDEALAWLEQEIAKMKGRVE